MARSRPFAEAFMRPYLDLLDRILTDGRPRTDRTGVGTRGLFGHQMRLSLRDSFPLLTTKKVFMRGIVAELLWFLSGSTNIAPLQAARVKIWDAWATEAQCARFGRPAGDLGPIYGHQWRNFGATPRSEGGWNPDGVDQIARAITLIKGTPDSRRILVTGWNPRESDQVALPPCHTLFQFHVQDGELSCQLYQRSADIFLGVPFNIASYALLTAMVAQVTGLKPGDFIHTFGDVHLYSNHEAQARLQLSRAPRAQPKLVLNPSVTDLFSFAANDIQIEGYDPHPTIKAAVAV